MNSVNIHHSVQKLLSSHHLTKW